MYPIGVLFFIWLACTGNVGNATVAIFDPAPEILPFDAWPGTLTIHDERGWSTDFLYLVYPPEETPYGTMHYWVSEWEAVGETDLGALICNDAGQCWEVTGHVTCDVPEQNRIFLPLIVGGD